MSDILNWQLYCKDGDGSEVNLGGLASAYECVALEWAAKRAKGGVKAGIVPTPGAHAFRVVCKTPSDVVPPPLRAEGPPPAAGVRVPFLPEGIKRIAPPKFK